MQGGLLINNDPIVEKIDLLIRFFLYVLIFWLPYSQAVVESCVVTAFVLWVVKRFLSALSVTKSHQFASAFKPADSFLNIPIAVFLFVCLLSAIGSGFPQLALKGFLTKTLEWFVIYFLVLEVFTQKKHIGIFLSVFLVTSAAILVDGWVQFYVTGNDIFSGHTIIDGRMTAAFRHPNQLGGYLLFLIPLLFSLLLLTEKAIRRWRSVLFLLLGMAVWSLFLTFSRGAWIGCVTGICCFLFLVNKKYFFVVMVIGVMAGGVIYGLSANQTKQQARMDAGALEGAIEWRLGLWEDTLKMIADRPLFGHGLNTYMRVFQEYRRKLNGQFEYGPTYAHNCFLQITAETGLLGLLAFLWILGRLFKETIKMIRESAAYNMVRILIALLAGTSGFLIHSLSDNHFYSLQLVAYFWVMVGVLVAVYKSLSDQSPAKTY